jgi:beta-lactamase regulating signal transducer with metallopeptidase domain
MSAAGSLFSIYLALNAAIAAGALSLLAVERLAPRLSARSLLRLHYGVAAALILSVALQALIPEGLWPVGALLSVDLRSLADSDAGALLTGSDAEPGRSFDAGSFARLWIATALVLLASGVAVILRDLHRLRALLRGSHLVRSIGQVRIWVHDGVPTPFSCWRPGRAHVVLPSFLLRDTQSWRIALAHELQHHRQRDTAWLHVFAALRVSCALNPFVHGWARAAKRTQEFACDEALIARRRWSPQAYARCLVDVADRMRGSGTLAGVTSCLIGFGDPNSLRRRMEKMFDKSRSPWTRKQVRLSVMSVCAFMTLAAHAGSAVTGERTEGNLKTVWPVDGVVLAGFGKHRGIDIAAPAGASVRAYAAGTVLTVDPAKGCPGRVQIRHDSLVGTYCNLSAVVVTVGQTVDAATVIGTVAVPPAGVKAHLHFELSEQTFIDPQSRLPRISAD